MKNNASALYSFFLVLGDALALTAAFSVAYTLRVKLDPRPLIEQIPAFEFLHAFLAVLPLWILVHAFIGLYHREVFEKRFVELGRLLVGSLLGILVVVGYDFVGEGNLFPARLVPVYGLAIGFGFLVIFRNLLRILRRALYRVGIGIADVLIIGDTPISKNLAQSLGDTKHSGINVIGVIGKNIANFACYKSLDDFLNSAPSLPHGIIQTELYPNQLKNDEILRYAQEHHISYRFVPGNSNLFVGNIEVELFAGLPVIAIHQTKLIGWGRIIKRIFDLTTATSILILSSPILLVIALLQLFNGGQPVFRQTRLTRFNREFTCYKFRTLKNQYNNMLPEEGFAKLKKPELTKQFRDNGDFLENDPRLTKLGLILRKTSLDELPQLINVIKGDLSLVGPRALVPRELNAYNKKHTILSVKAGLTGLAQISGRKSINFEERRKLDMYYVQNWTFWLDISILIRTIRVVITGTGAK
jgi:exopolysaccharide biosynthesis polyprenyl glycosylphosphotransferase